MTSNIHQFPVQGQQLGEQRLAVHAGKLSSRVVTTIAEKVELAKAFEQAIKVLQDKISQSKSEIQSWQWSYPLGPESFEVPVQKGTTEERIQEVKSAIRYLEKKREEKIPSGVLKGLEVIKLQQELRNSQLHSSAKQMIYQRIAEKFESAASYEEMYDLRETVDGSSVGSSQLHKLVYDDVDVDRCHRIIRAINENVTKAYHANPEQIKFNYMVYSDIDDTIKGSLNDRHSNIDGFYPSALEFYKQLGCADPIPKSTQEGGRQTPISTQVKLSFLSARPKAQSPLWNQMMRKQLPGDM